MLRFLLVLPFLVLKVALRRLFHGPRRPTWSFTFEAANEVVRWLIERLVGQFLKHGRGELPTPRLRGSMVTRTARTAGTLAGLRAEWITPAGRSPKRLVLYLHGGGWVSGSIDTHRELMCRLALAADARVVGIDYRLAPEHPFPAGHDDCVAAYRALLAAGEDPRQLVVAGDSAGGGLTMSTLLVVRASGEPLPAAAVLLSPAVDLGLFGGAAPDNAEHDYLAFLANGADGLLPFILGKAGRVEDPLVSPARAELGGLPPMLVLAGEVELLRDQIVAFAEKARAAGVPVELLVGQDMVHVWPAFAGIEPRAKEAVRRIGAFIAEATSAPLPAQRVGRQAG